MTIGELLNIDERQVASGCIDKDVLTDKMTTLKDSQPDVYDSVIAKYPQLAIIPISLNAVETATTTAATISKTMSDTKNTAEGFTPVLSFSAVPKLASEKASQFSGGMKVKIENTTNEKVIGLLLDQEIEV